MVMVAPSSGQPSHGLAMMVTTMVTTMVTITNLGYRGCVTDYYNIINDIFNRK